MSGGWSKGTSSRHGKRGLFPDNFVKVLSEGKQVPTPRVSADKSICGKKFKVRYRYLPNNEDELALNVGDIVEVISEIEEGWWEGRIHNRVGVFPSNFVGEMVDIPSASGTSSTQQSPAKAEVASERKNAAPATVKVSTEGEESSSSEFSTAGPSLGGSASAASTPIGLSSSVSSSGGVALLGGLPLSDTSASGSSSGSSLAGSVSTGLSSAGSTVISTTVAPSSVNSTGSAVTGPSTVGSSSVGPVLPPKPVKEMCLVLFPYEAKHEDELTLMENDVIMLLSKDLPDKGWWKGQLNGKVGVFPDNFVKLLTFGEELAKPERPPPAKLQSKTYDTPAKQFTVAALRKSLEDTTRTDENLDLGKTPLSPSSLGKTSFSKSTGGRRNFQSRLAAIIANSKNEESRASTKPVPAVENKKVPCSSKNFIKNFLSSHENLVESKMITKSVDSLDGCSSSKVNTLDDSTSAKESKINENRDPVSIDDLNAVERMEMLKHPTASRVKAPKRRPPSGVTLKEIADTDVMKGDTTDYQADDSDDDDEPSTSTMERNKQLMKELKSNYGKKNGRAWVMVKPKNDQAESSPSEMSVSSSVTVAPKPVTSVVPVESVEHVATAVPSTSAVIATTQDSTMVTLRSGFTSAGSGVTFRVTRPVSMFSAEPATTFTGRPKMPAPQPPVLVDEAKITKHEYLSLLEQMESQKEMFNRKMDEMTALYKKEIDDLKKKLNDEVRLRLEMKKEIDKLLNIVTQV